jgi:hypothetical protein
MPSCTLRQEQNAGNHEDGDDCGSEGVALSAKPPWLTMRDHFLEDVHGKGYLSQGAGVGSFPTGRSECPVANSISIAPLLADVVLVSTAGFRDRPRWHEADSSPISVVLLGSNRLTPFEE